MMIPILFPSLGVAVAVGALYYYFARHIRPPKAGWTDKTYVIVEPSDSYTIVCLRCGTRSQLPGDVNYRYCGYCHKAHQ